MFFKSKFSIAKAWVTSFTISFDNIVFYIGWNLIVLTIGMVLFGLLGVAMGIFDIQALMQDYSWIQKFILSIFRTISLDSLKSIKEATGHEPYDIFKLIFPENILNHVLENKSWKEYFNVILMQNKVMIFLIGMLISIFSMTTTIGYIKTALKLQDGQKASFCDMYQYFYLVPQYFLAKLMMISLLLLIALPFGGFLFFIESSFKKSEPFFVLVIILVFALMFLPVNFIYQRIKFMQYLVIDKNMPVADALKTSWSITKGNVMHLSLYSLLGTFLSGTFFGRLSSFFRLFYNNADKQTEVSVYKQLTQ